MIIELTTACCSINKPIKLVLDKKCKPHPECHEKKKDCDDDCHSNEEKDRCHKKKKDCDDDCRSDEEKDRCHEKKKECDTYRFKIKCPKKYKIFNCCTAINNVAIIVPLIIEINKQSFEITEPPVFRYINLTIQSQSQTATVTLVDGYYWIQLELSDKFVENIIYIEEFTIESKACCQIECKKGCGLTGELMLFQS